MTGSRLVTGKNFADIVIIGNSSAAAGAIARFRELSAAAPSGSSPSVLVLEADTEEQIASRMPEFNARVSFPDDLGLTSPGECTITTYDKVAFYSPRMEVRKSLPVGKVVLLDVNRLVSSLEKDLPANITIKYHKQIFNAAYVSTGNDTFIELSVQYPFSDGKVFECTDRIYCRGVIDCSGTASVMLDKMQGYRNDSAIVCGVLGFKVIGATIPDTGEVSLALDDAITHGAGAWSYPNSTLSPDLASYIDRWFATSSNRRVKELIKGKSAADFSGTIADVGISSISAYSNVHHYRDNLERQAEDLFSHLPAYEKMFRDSAVIPGSAFYKPSPVLQPVSRMAGYRYILAGDAAGHATPYIGEGVRPGIEMGRAAADIFTEACRTGDFSEKFLRGSYEKIWWERYGIYDIWSDLFRHFSSTCFSDRQWDAFMAKLQNLSDDEFYDILKSEYSTAIVLKMFPEKLVPYYFRYQLRRLVTFISGRLNLRQISSWIK